jgi:ankyrin repeat protein
MAAAVEQQHARAIVDAAERGDLEEVRRLVQQNQMLLNAVVWAYQWEDRSPLTAAANRGRVEVVRYLLDEGADIDLWTGEYGTALATACSEGRLAVVALLLASGADTAPDRHGWTPLIGASGKGHTDIVELLLAHGYGDVDAQESTGRAALHRACFNGRAGVVRALLGAGANPHLVDQYGRTPLRHAVGVGREGCVALLQVNSLCCECGILELLGWHTISPRHAAQRACVPAPHTHTHTGVGALLPPH